MPHVDKYVVAFVVVSETLKMDIPQCTSSAQSLASQYRARSGSLASTNVTLDIGKNIVMLTMIDQ